MIDQLSQLKIKTFSLIPTHRIFSYKYQIDYNFQYAGALLENNNIILNPKFKKNDGEKINDNDLICILAHEILHDLYQHIPRCKAFLGKYCSQDDEILWNLAADEIVNRTLIEIADKKNMDVSFIKENGVNLTRVYGEIIKKKPVEILYRFLKENTEIIKINTEKIKINDTEIKTVTCVIIDKDTAQVIFPYNKLILVERDEDGSIKNETPLSGRYIYELERSLLAEGIESETLSSEVKMIKSPLSLKKNLENHLNIIKSGLEDITFFKHGKLNIIFPHSKLQYPTYISRKCNVVIGVDVSGSINDENFAEFISIIYSNLNFFEGKIYFCDTEIKSEFNLIDKTEEELKNIYKKLQIRTGGGGTLFNPVFEQAKKIPNLDLLIYFTDLFPFKWPAMPKFKVLWVVKGTVETLNRKVPFGKVIYY